MSWEENKEYTESKLNVQPEPPKPYSFVRKVWKYVLVGVICFLLGFSVPQSRANKVAQRNRDLSKRLQEIQDKPAETVLVPFSIPSPETKSIENNKDAAPVNANNKTETTDNTYDHNDYYDIVEASILNDNASHYTTVIHKVLAKKDGSVSADLIAYDPDGNVIEKDSEMIILTEGNYNYFKYVFSKDISNASIQARGKTEACSFTPEQRNGVEMVSYNQNEKDLYITFKQNTDNIGNAEYKLIFYKDDKIIDTNDGLFWIKSDYFNKKGDTDVIELFVSNPDYDRFEYIYQPSLFD